MAAKWCARARLVTPYKALRFNKCVALGRRRLRLAVKRLNQHATGLAGAILALRRRVKLWGRQLYREAVEKVSGTPRVSRHQRTDISPLAQSVNSARASNKGLQERLFRKCAGVWLFVADSEK
jgi:hypothetical protein